MRLCMMHVSIFMSRFGNTELKLKLTPLHFFEIYIILFPFKSYIYICNNIWVYPLNKYIYDS